MEELNECGKYVKEQLENQNKFLDILRETVNELNNYDKIQEEDAIVRKKELLNKVLKSQRWR